MVHQRHQEANVSLPMAHQHLTHLELVLFILYKGS